MTRLHAGRWWLALLPIAAALSFAEDASAHANLSPPVVTAKTSQMFTLAVPTEKDGLTTTQIEMTPPAGFSIDSFVPAAGWKRATAQTGSGEAVVIQKATWSGGSVPTGEDAVFEFLGRPDAAGTYAFKVRQTYSDGSVVDWSGPESSDTPNPTVVAKGALGGGSTTLTVIALVLAVLALVLAAVGLLRGGGRELA
jgi:uncharacterized protein YcnI